MDCPFNSLDSSVLPFYFRDDEGGSINGASFFDQFGSNENVFQFHIDDEINAVSLNTGSIYKDMMTIINNISSTSTNTNTVSDHTYDYKLQIGQIEKWVNASAGSAAHTINYQERVTVVDSKEQCKGKLEDQKALRRLAQNREAARNTRMRKKAHVQELENSRQRLTELEQELKTAREQGIMAASGLISGDGHINQTMGGNVKRSDSDYAHWFEEHQGLINEMRSALNSQTTHESEVRLCLVVEGVMLHYDEIFRLRSTGAKSDVFHMLSGTWNNRAERCLLWLGGFRSSEILKILVNQIEPLTEQQMVGISNLKRSAEQSEDALSQGMEALQNSLVVTLSSSNSCNALDCVEIAMRKFSELESFLHQEDLLRQQTLRQLQRILTTIQLARALVAINDCNSRLIALNSLWSARPKE